MGRYSATAIVVLFGKGVQYLDVSFKVEAEVQGPRLLGLGRKALQVGLHRVIHLLGCSGLSFLRTFIARVSLLDGFDEVVVERHRDLRRCCTFRA